MSVRFFIRLAYSCILHPCCLHPHFPLRIFSRSILIICERMQTSLFHNKEVRHCIFFFSAPLARIFRCCYNRNWLACRLNCRRPCDSSHVTAPSELLNCRFIIIISLQGGPKSKPLPSDQKPYLIVLKHANEIRFIRHIKEWIKYYNIIRWY